MDRLWQLAPERVGQFDKIALAYDRYRPGYPEPMYCRLAAATGLGPGSHVVEVGAGTGIASLPLARRGYRLVAIEPGPSLAAITAEKLRPFADCEVLISRFEDWTGQPQSYDLVFAADAWHWIEPTVGFSKAMQLLRPAGAIAIASHRVAGFRPDDFGDRVRERMRQRGRSEPEPPTWGPDPEQWGAAIDACGFFDEPLRHVYRFERVLDADAFAALQATYGSNLDLPSSARAALDLAVRQVINDELDGEVIKVEEAVLFTAHRS